MKHSHSAHSLLLLLFVSICFKQILGATTPICSAAVYAFFPLSQSLNYASFCQSRGLTTLSTTNSLPYSALTNDVSYCSGVVASFNSVFFSSLNPSQCLYYSPAVNTFFTTACADTTPYVACIGSPPSPYTVITSTISITSTSTSSVVALTTLTVFYISTSFSYLNTVTVSVTSLETVTSLDIATSSTLTTAFTTTTNVSSISSLSISTSTVRFLEFSSTTLTETLTSTDVSIETAVLKTTYLTTTTTSSCPITSTSVVIIPSSVTLTVTSFVVATVTELVPVATTSNCQDDE